MASVRLDNLHDPRFKLLGKLLCSSNFDAIGRLSFVYEYCTEKDTAIVPELILDALTDTDGFSEKLIQADLAEKTENGIRIKGTEGRIEWLAKRRAAARKGGEANKAKFEPKESQKEAKSEPKGSPKTKAKAKANKNILTNPISSGSFDFQAIYDIYPKKVGKTDGIAECEKQIQTPEDYEALKASATRYRDYICRIPQEGEFIPSPKDFSTFMRKGRWRDCLEADFGVGPKAVSAVKVSAPPAGQSVPDAEATKKMLQIFESVAIAKSIPSEAQSFLKNLGEGA